MRHQTSLALTFSAFAVLAAAGPAARAQVELVSTFGSSPAAGWLSINPSLGQSFTVPFSGVLSGFDALIHLDFGQYQTYDWSIEDLATGETLASGLYEFSGNSLGYGLELMLPTEDAIAVEAGQELLFTLAQHEPGGFVAVWRYGDASSHAPYADGTAWMGLTQIPTKDLRLRVHLQPCTGDFYTPADPTISVPLAIEVAVGSDHGTLTGAAEDPDRLASISFDGVTDPVVAWPSSGAPTTAAIDAEVAVTWAPEAQSINGQVFDHCGNFTAVEIPISYYVCVPESPVCADGALGTVFYVPLEPSDDGCYIRCTTDALGDNLACQHYCGL